MLLLWFVDAFAMVHRSLLWFVDAFAAVSRSFCCGSAKLLLQLVDAFALMLLLWFVDVFAVVRRCFCCGSSMRLLWFVDAFAVVRRCFCCGLSMLLLLSRVPNSGPFYFSSVGHLRFYAREKGTSFFYLKDVPFLVHFQVICIRQQQN